MLCSDGLWGPLKDDDVLAGLAGADVMQAVPKLLDHSEALAGKLCDNLSMVAMCWQDDTGACWQDDTGAVAGDSISTRTMAQDRFTTRLDTFDRNRSSANAFDLTEDEIERAIAEINSAIQKFSK